MKHLTKKEQEIAQDEINVLKLSIRTQEEVIKKSTAYLKMLKYDIKQDKALLDIVMFVAKYDDDKERE